MALITRGNNMRLLRGGRVQAMIMPGKPRDDTPPQPVFSPADLFAAGEQGIWYDPSDFSSMFQDSAGTIPVTAIEQPVGLILDKSGRGNHASQSTATTAKPILRNLYNMLICQTTMATQNVTTLAASYTLRFTGAGTVTLSGTASGVLSAGSNAFTATAGTLTLTVSGTVSEAMLTPTYEESLPFQSVTSNTPSSGVYNTDLSKFKPYLFFDGTDDWMNVGTVNFSATDKISVFAGVNRLSDSVNQLLVKFFNTNPSLEAGTFYINAWNAFNSKSYVAGLYGTSGGTYGFVNSGYLAPTKNVLTVLHDIGATLRTDEIKIMIDTSPITLTYVGTNAGTGNFGTWPLSLGSSTSSALNGRLYSLIIRGAMTFGTQLTNTEAWVNSKTGAY